MAVEITLRRTGVCEFADLEKGMWLYSEGKK